MDKGCVTGTVFLDLRKVFDTVDHLLLIDHLKSLGVAGESLELFRSYLSGRVQQTMWVNALSPPAKITMGVPQDSILGPLLFLVNTNGIQPKLQHSNRGSQREYIVQNPLKHSIVKRILVFKRYKIFHLFGFPS